MQNFEATKCPSDELSLTNKIFFNPNDVRSLKNQFIKIHSGSGSYAFLLDSNPSIPTGKAGFSLVQRRWANVSIGQPVGVEFNCSFDPRTTCIATHHHGPLQFGRDANRIHAMLSQMPLTVGQEIVFKFKDKKHLLLRVKEMETLQPRGDVVAAQFGVISGNTIATFEKLPDSPLVLTGKAKAKQPYQSIINPDWNFSMMGIGGLDREFSDIFRRTFASRIFPPDLVEQLGMCHVRGLLLYGPPGTGKTLMARQIGKMLRRSRAKNSVNGPSILDKTSGERKSKIRELFADAEEESHSGIGNRLRFAYQSASPDEHGRHQILGIHTSKIRDNGKLSPDVDVRELAAKTKNFSGAELAGLVRAATVTAMNRLVQASEKVQVDPDAIEKLCVTRHDFLHALEYDIRPSFGAQEEELDRYVTGGLVKWGNPVNHVIEHGLLATRAARAEAEAGADSGRPVALLLEGPRNSGKTALAVHIARQAGFSYVRLATSKNMVGFNEVAKCMAVKKFFDDAHKAKQAVVILDGLEGLIDYSPVGPRYSNYVLQALRDLITAPLPRNKCLLLLGTTSCRDALEELGLVQCFTAGKIHVSNLTQPEHLVTALNQLDAAKFTEKEVRQIYKSVSGCRLNIGIKELLDVARMTNRVEEGDRVRYFLDRLNEDGRLTE
uniref:Vesicle-fusing ATPase n=1 Tax=Macrostomum lignano TaxID=282301 RepID=A0A1I8JEW6_9PLAT